MDSEIFNEQDRYDDDAMNNRDSLYLARQKMDELRQEIAPVTEITWRQAVDAIGKIADIYGLIELAEDSAEKGGRGEGRKEIRKFKASVLLYEALIRGIGLGQKKIALDRMNRALELEPDYANAHFVLGLMDLDLGRRKRAEARLRNIRKRDRGISVIDRILSCWAD